MRLDLAANMSSRELQVNFWLEITSKDAPSLTFYHAQGIIQFRGSSRKFHECTANYLRYQAAESITAHERIALGALQFFH